MNWNGEYEDKLYAVKQDLTKSKQDHRECYYSIVNK